MNAISEINKICPRENAERRARYDAFATGCGLQVAKYDWIVRTGICPNPSVGWDHVHYWCLKGARRYGTMFITVEPYGGKCNAETAIEHFKSRGWIARGVPGVAMHHPSTTVVIASSPIDSDALDDLVGRARRVGAIRKTDTAGLVAAKGGAI